MALGAEVTPSALLALTAALNQRVGECGIILDPRPFALHMTLLRNASGPPLLEVAPLITWQVQSFSLVNSTTRSSGPIYRVIRTWSLDQGQHKD